MTNRVFVISFSGSSPAEANRYAVDLSSVLRQIDPTVSAEQQRDREETQDIGTTVAVILGTASAIEVAKGIASWLTRHSGASIQINADGSVIASNLGPGEAPRIAEALAKHN